MTARDEFSALVLELLAPLGPVAARRMFGGVGLFHRGTIFGLIVREELFFKVGEANRAEYEAAGQAPLTYATRHGEHRLASYWSCPPELLDDPDRLRAWAGKAVDVALAAARSPRRRKAR
jgi:DNA transformation protein